jgi:hypothetical protein
MGTEFSGWLKISDNIGCSVRYIGGEQEMCVFIGLCL